MTVAGNWTLHYSWGFTGNYAQAPITFSTDGTFGGTYSGKWRQLAGTLMLTFDRGPAKYGGTINGTIGSGLMSTFSGLDGFWYLSEQGTTGILPAETTDAAAKQPAAADGSPTSEGERQLVGAGAKQSRSGNKSKR
jgi:hypothetical protein